jgi:hypothetical protein
VKSRVLCETERELQLELESATSHQRGLLYGDEAQIFQKPSIEVEGNLRCFTWRLSTSFRLPAYSVTHVSVCTGLLIAQWVCFDKALA